MTDPYAAPSQPNPGAGRIALTFGVVVIVITVAQQVFNRFIPLLMVQLSLDSGAIGGIFAIASIVIGIVALVAVIFGWLAVQRRGADAVIGGIGLGIGGSALINAIFAFVSAPVVSLWLS